MNDYATIEDVITLFRALSPEETERASALIPVICATLREEGRKVGKNLDSMIEENADLALIAKSVTVDIVGRVLQTPTNQTPMTQMSEGALGYTFSGTFLSPGGGLFIKNSELARLGLKRQRYGVINLC